jgi:raffinose/stachyose/melibiose transport system substrate-binding protein
MEFASRIPGTFLPGLSLNNELYGVPVGGTAVGVLWNLTVMEENGFALPQTWSEMLQLCADARAIGKTAWAMGGADGWPTIMVPYALSATLIYGATPDFDQDQLAQEVTFSNSAWVAVMDQFVEAIDADCFQDNALGTGFQESLTMVAQGDVLGAPQVNALLSMITAEAPEGTQLTIAPIPATEDAAATQFTASLGANYAVNADSENLPAALAFIDFLTSDAGQEIYLTNSAGFPMLIGGNFELDSTLDILLEFLAADRIGLIPDQSWTSPQVQVAMIDGLQGLLLESTDVASVLAAMDAEYAAGLEG